MGGGGGREREREGGREGGMEVETFFLFRSPHHFF